jgi:hypothetical protein
MPMAPARVGAAETLARAQFIATQWPPPSNTVATSVASVPRCGVSHACHTPEARQSSKYLDLELPFLERPRDPLGGSRGKRRDRERRVHAATGHKHAAVRDEKVRDVVGAAECIHD